MSHVCTRREYTSLGPWSQRQPVLSSWQVISTVVSRRYHSSDVIFGSLELHSHSLAEATQDSDIGRKNGGNDLHALLFTVLTVSRLSLDGIGDHGPNNLISDLLLSERQGQRTGVKGELVSSLKNGRTTVIAPDVHYPATRHRHPGMLNKKTDPYHPIGTAVPLGIDGVYTNFRFLLDRNVGVAVGHPLQMKINQT